MAASDVQKTQFRILFENAFGGTPESMGAEVIETEGGTLAAKAESGTVELFTVGSRALEWRKDGQKLFDFAVFRKDPTEAAQRRQQAGL